MLQVEAAKRMAMDAAKLAAPVVTTAVNCLFSKK